MDIPLLFGWYFDALVSRHERPPSRIVRVLRSGVQNRLTLGIERFATLEHAGVAAADTVLVHVITAHAIRAARPASLEWDVALARKRTLAELLSHPCGLLETPN